jgi:hypothetical protein
VDRGRPPPGGCFITDPHLTRYAAARAAYVVTAS